ncbi:hypothetical protein, partial [Mycobacterium avium]|uniref:hypothetical protein n=1 Tax=Mycobacterium avium TaxID=1764 RepID=UPI001BAF905C
PASPTGCATPTTRREPPRISQPPAAEWGLLLATSGDFYLAIDNYFHDWLCGFSGPLTGGVTNRGRRPGAMVWWRIKILPNDKGI